MRQFRYVDDNGDFDYERYKFVQVSGNLQKLACQWVSHDSIEFISNYLKLNVRPIQFGICHGTRRGLEQRWFRHHLGCDVIGTEISPTATQFEHTLEWDFHEVKPDWSSRCDFIYSNSWDHSYDPVRLFTAWFSCLRVGGICVLEHTANQTTVNELDPLGLELDELAALANGLAPDKCRVKDVLRNGPVVGLEGMECRADHVTILRHA